MKKTLLTICLSLMSMSAMLAQNYQPSTLYAGEFDAASMEGFYGTVYGVSANGQYAVGVDDLFESGCFIWNRSTGKYEMIDLGNYVSGVSNDGVIVGEYWIEIPGTDGMTASKPGYYKNGEWHPLPIHRLDVDLIDDYNGRASAISPDGKFIAGFTLDADVFRLRPILWEWDETAGDYVIKNDFEDIEPMGNGWVVNGMSNDGTILSGFCEWGSGARSAAVIVNGVEKRLTCLKDPLDAYLEDGVEGYIDTEGNAIVSGNGQHVVGHYAESANGFGTKGWYWNTSMDQVEYNEGNPYTCVSDDGVIFGSIGLMGSPCKVENGIATDLNTLYDLTNDAGFVTTPMACSADGSVLGGFIVSSGGIGAVPIPYVLVMGESGAVLSTKGDTNVVIMHNNTLLISGEYDKALVYNMQGMCVAESNEGNIDMNNAPAGIYVVKVDNATYKVIK